jgi:hypothetical protein
MGDFLEPRPLYNGMAPDLPSDDPAYQAKLTLSAMP